MAEQAAPKGREKKLPEGTASQEHAEKLWDIASSSWVESSRMFQEGAERGDKGAVKVEKTGKLLGSTSLLQGER